MRRVDTDSRPLGREHEPMAGLHRIVVALDGTPFAEAALAPAVAMGRAYNAEVVLVRAHAARAEPVPTRLGLRRHERETLARASLYLARIEQDLRAHGVRAVGISPLGRATDAIAEVACHDGDLVVLATHAGAGLARSAQVSVARELATRVEVPMLLVSPAAKGLFTLAASTPTIVVALDGERRDDLALRLVTTLARLFDARVVAVGSTHGAAGKHEPGGPGGQVAREHHAARVMAYLETVRFHLSRCGVAAWTAVIEGDPTVEIAEFVRAEGDLVVLGVHGTLARREATVEAALALLRFSGSALLLVPQEPLLTLVPGGPPARQLSGGIR
jgi:nucleotide-binding universal stress UspA family protein